MYVPRWEKETYTHIFAHNFLNIQPIFNPEKKSWKGETYFENIPSNTALFTKPLADDWCHLSAEALWILMHINEQGGRHPPTHVMFFFIQLPVIDDGSVMAMSLMTQNL